MPIDLYQTPGSAPCSAVRLTAAAVGVNLNLKETNLMAGEHLQPEFLKMNPQHTIPTIDDNGFYLWESRAIMGYLVDQYGKNDSLYPKDPKKRAVVNQRLFFDANILYQSLAEYYYPMIFAGAPKDNSKYEKIEKAFEFLDKFLENDPYVAGKNLTIADHSVATTVSNFELMEYDFSKFQNVSKWFKRVKSEIVKYDEIRTAGIKAFKALMETLSKKK
ncbi:glutathione S-transferase 1-1-like [Polistes fuscatus]|uniref:glutathione S-transferase 1-1-like n=1 Tax=Polistes fuscatus TaxID=30207 RepID=UPI001CA8F14C|nr:glutathione S-transferase 1-1-like [Polistes fuscatus]